MDISQHDPNSKPNRSGGPDVELYTIPSNSSWFRWDDIHETERIALKEFFDGSSISRTPKIYKEYRDFMINKYREEPYRRLTFTQVRKSLVGDVSLLHKVFNCLDKWGLINFGAPASDNRDNLEDIKLQDQVRVEEGAPNGVRVGAMPNSLRPLSPPQSAGEGRVLDGENGFKLPLLASYSDVFGDLVKLKGLKCMSCGEKCDSGCYEYCKQGRFIICVKCFKNGNYGENKSMDDFKFNDGNGKNVTHGSTWTEAEILLLLESVMKHGDDWELVAQNVKTKSKLDCISKLIELPFGEFIMGPGRGRGGPDGSTGSSNIATHGLMPSSEHHDTKVEDQVHEQMDETEQNGDAASQEPPAKRIRIASLSDAGGSLIKQVALISTMGGPHITAAAAEAAITALCDESSCPREIFDDNEEAYQVGALETKETSSQSGSQETCTENNDIPLTLRIRAATATALGVAASNAKLLADQEDREIEHLVATMIETQLKKLHCKIKHFEDLELIMEKEYAEMLELKECLVAERIDVLQRALSAGVSKWRDHTYIKSQTAITVSLSGSLLWGADAIGLELGSWNILHH
ncbi:SWI/SNF complex subunit SWI3A-like isoform X3 [Pistacia vera]|uniref:SWI/SNF complex subunit SWI3A-like isoform X3 n=1 Tax=Pistacia vera TaxID=55513 RepID=UPI001262CEF6|nr:SWI/SNF complex subunit SWI3A-like isoform X3 [Pistacia vera]XP_031247717.1 SWI/SNF complex subunit SWI3A-like isoform X3 [Pistacia vera]